MSSVPNYTGKVAVGAATLTTGDTSRTAPSTTQTIFTPDATNALGGMCERITVIPLATVTTTIVRLFMYDGTAYHLFAEVPMPATTVGTSTLAVPAVLSAVDYPAVFPKMVPAGWLIRATINDTQTGVKIIAEGGSF